MYITFQIEYHTAWGESLFLALNEGYLRLLPMKTEGNGIWIVTVETDNHDISWLYTVRNQQGDLIREEWGKPRHLTLSQESSIHIFDKWHDRLADSPFLSSAFTECFFRRPKSESTATKRLTLYVLAPTLSPGRKLAICGSLPEIGSWDINQSVLLDSGSFPYWKVTLDILPTAEIEYKFCVIEPDGTITWESGDNRHLRVPQVLASTTILEVSPFVDTAERWKCAGVAIPVFSLRSKEDCGIGDFYDLIPFADWTAATGQRIIQILPVNDTTMTHTWTDSYPYNAISTFALHPAYLRVEAVGTLPEDDYLEFRNQATLLNDSTVVEYEAAVQLKFKTSKRLYELYGEGVLDSEDFIKFFNRNSYWLRPYAAFCVLRDRYGTCDFSKWENYAEYSDDKIIKLESDEKYLFGYWYFIQYHLDRQLTHVRDYCHSLGVCIKGDIPIGISRTSVDAWQFPHLFNLDVCAGAPPDDFAVLGQNWGFPTYNWLKMSEDGFAWWKDRFMKMADFFDAYRIDHLLGFFRIWEIPLSALHGLLGTFNAALPLSPEEMLEYYGFVFDRELYTRPYITDRVLKELFGAEYRNVALDYFSPPVDGYYSFKTEFSSQRAIADHFAATSGDKTTDSICNLLLRLMDDVLFIEDPRHPGLYHPRITPGKSFIYNSLSDSAKESFDRLYEDFYYHRSDRFWQEQAMWKLPPLIDSTGMLCCGEDLGMIPPCVPEVMRRLEILSLKVQRMPDQPGVEFADTSLYPYYSVSTTSTHDMSGIRGWWQDDHARATRFYTTRLGGKTSTPAEATPWICDEIIRMHLDSPSMLCILPLQDWLSIDSTLRRVNPEEEQINDPANSANNWNYRMHLTIEQLNQATDYNERIRWMINRAKR